MLTHIDHVKLLIRCKISFGLEWDIQDGGREVYRPPFPLEFQKKFFINFYLLTSFLLYFYFSHQKENYLARHLGFF